ncbi:MAG: hypothetical protein ACRDTG_06695 [Pseudonocardiaceae bacterium]
MADLGVPDTDGDTNAPTQQRRPDLLTLIAGLGALAVAIGVPLGAADWLAELDTRWVLAATATFVGLLLVIGSIRPRRR